MIPQGSRADVFIPVIYNEDPATGAMRDVLFRSLSRSWREIMAVGE